MNGFFAHVVDILALIELKWTYSNFSETKFFKEKIYRKCEARNSRIEKYEELTEIEPI